MAPRQSEGATSFVRVPILWNNMYVDCVGKYHRVTYNSKYIIVLEDTMASKEPASHF